MISLADTFGSASFHEEYLAAKIQAGLQVALDSKGISRVELAKLMNVSKARVSQIFSDNANFTVKTIARACHALGIAAEDLLAGRIETKSIAVPNDANSRADDIAELTGLWRAAVPSPFKPGSWNLDEFIEASSESRSDNRASGLRGRQIEESKFFRAANDESWPESVGHIRNMRVFA